MEFYCRNRAYTLIVMSFQFPTGWNSTLVRLLSFLKIQSFNSQRDVILLNTYLTFAYFKDKFQFPTGWNSTLRNITCRIMPRAFQFPTGWNSTKAFFWKTCGICSVSIPNGMEFYADGRVISILQKLFQFPTGWNSTIKDKSCESELRFNSQRDGILRCSS